jgi:hypothetical protein
MSDEITVAVTLPTDDEGMLGRECPECGKYFKVKPGTGLDISTCTCPYCEYATDAGEFLTEAQLEYVTSLAGREVLGPWLAELERSLRELERETRRSLIQIKVTTRGFDVPIEYYTEKDLETTVECDSCALVFAIYGVFASCPHCARPITMSMFRKSLEVTRKRLSVLENIPAQEPELREALLADTLCGGVATFDSLGKRLRGEFPSVFPARPRNLFQNLDALAQALERSISVELKELIGEDDYSKVDYMFQVRHIWTHNFGEADEGFARKTKSDPSVIGTKIVPSAGEVGEFLALVERLGLALRDKLTDGA